MDVSNYSLEDLLLLGIKSEEVAKEEYQKIADEAKRPGQGGGQAQGDSG